MTEYTVRAGGGGAGGTLPTLAAAVAIAKPGDVFHVEPGVYAGGFRPPEKTTWLGQPGAIIDGGWKGGNLTAGNDDAKGLLVRYAGVVVRGFEIRNVPGQGVAVTAGGHRFLMENCEIHHTFHGGLAANGLGTPIEGITIRGCHVHDIALSGRWHETPVNGCFLFKSAYDVLIEDCLIERGYGEGIAAGSRSRNVTFRRVTVRDTRHLLMYASNRAQNVLIEDCVLYQRGLEEFRQSDGQVGGGLVIGDEESGAKDDSWQHGENVTIRRCLVVNAGKLFELRNQKKTGKGGGQDGYNTTIKNLSVVNCTFVAGPDTRSGVNISENEYGDGNVAGRFEANVFIGAASFRNGAAGVRFTGNAFTDMPPGLAGDNLHIPADALVNPFVSIDAERGLNLNNYRPQPGGVLDIGNIGALRPSPDEPPVDPPPPPPPDEEPTPIDWPALRTQAAAIGAEVDALIALIDEYASAA